MKHCFFHIPAIDPHKAEIEMNNFCASHLVVSIDKSLVQNGANTYWTFCIGYQDANETTPVTRKGRVDYKEVLNEADFTVFARLRTLRKEMAEREGVPAYALFTNEQLAEMVTRRVSSPAELQEIDGIGETKLKKYGEAFLAELKEGFAVIKGKPD